MTQAPEDTRRMHREIVDDVGAVLASDLAADAWGRVLVEVIRGAAGEPVVAGVDVEEVSDEARVDAVFASDEARALMPMLAKATEALCALEDVDLEEVRGGTFVRLEQGFGWLPGLVRAPSPRLDQERDALLGALHQKNEGLRARFAAERVELDVEEGALRWVAQGKVLGSARATLLGSFSRATRMWGWAWSNPSAPDDLRRAAAAVTDALEERDVWELSTPVFTTDEATAWALTAYVCDRTRAAGVQRMAQEDGAFFVLLRDVSGA